MPNHANLDRLQQIIAYINEELDSLQANNILKKLEDEYISNLTAEQADLIREVMPISKRIQIIIEFYENDSVADNQDIRPDVTQSPTDSRPSLPISKQSATRKNLVNNRGSSKEIRILVLHSNPDDTTPTDGIITEFQTINDVLNRPNMPYRVISGFESTAKLLIKRISDNPPHILHFYGHGSIDGKLVAKGADNSSFPIDIQGLTELIRVIRAHNPEVLKLLVLNACWSSATANASCKVLECAIGMSRPIQMDTATLFSEHFYAHLSSGYNVLNAFEGANAALKMLKPEETNILEIFPSRDSASNIFFH